MTPHSAEQNHHEAMKRRRARYKHDLLSESDDALRLLDDLASITMSVPESARARVTRALERISAETPRQGYAYDRQNLATAAMRVIDVCWRVGKGLPTETGIP